MNVNLFDFYLPEELISQKPSEQRQNSRLLVLNNDLETIEDKHFYDIETYFN